MDELIKTIAKTNESVDKLSEEIEVAQLRETTMRDSRSNHFKARRSESRMNFDANLSRNILPVVNGVEIEDDANLGGADPNQLQYDRRVKDLVFPRNTHDNHDEYCDQIAETVYKGLAMGIADRNVAVALTNHIEKSNLRLTFKTELGQVYLPTTTQVLEALRNCEQQGSDMTNEEKFRAIAPRNQESYHNLIKRIQRFFENYKVADDKHKTRMVKEQFIRAIPYIPGWLANQINIPLITLEALPAYVQREMTKLGRPKHVEHQYSGYANQKGNQGAFQHNRFPQQGPRSTNENTVAPVQQEGHQEENNIPNQLPDQEQQNQPQQQGQQPTTPQQQYRGQNNSSHQQSKQMQQPMQNYQRQSGHNQPYNNDQERRPYCVNCRRAGHTSFTCEFVAFCSICSKEGHTNKSHYTNNTTGPQSSKSNNYQNNIQRQQWTNVPFTYGGTNQQEQHATSQQAAGSGDQMNA